MLVKCKKYSVTYPTGVQSVGDIFDLPKIQAEYYNNLGWVEILPQEKQPKGKRGKRKVESHPTNLSNSPQNGRFLEHTFK